MNEYTPAGIYNIRGDASVSWDPQHNNNDHNDHGGTVCGNGVCESGETCSNCPSDCGSCTVCGNGVCESGETCSNCPSDCGSCPNGCTSGAIPDPDSDKQCTASWQTISQLGVTSYSAVIESFSDRLIIATRGTGNQVWVEEWNVTNQSLLKDWYTINSGTTQSLIKLVSDSVTVHLYIQGMDGNIDFSTYQSPGSWSNWVNTGICNDYFGLDGPFSVQASDGNIYDVSGNNPMSLNRCGGGLTLISINPSFVFAGQNVIVTVNISDARYSAGHPVYLNLTIDGIKWQNSDCNIASINLTVPGTFGTSNCVNCQDWPAGTISEDGTFNIQSTCKIPVGITGGTHTLTVIPTVYSQPISLSKGSTSFFVGNLETLLQQLRNWLGLK